MKSPQSQPRTSGIKNILEVLRNREYGLYIAGLTLSRIGTWVQRVAVAWLVWEITRSPVWLGLVAAADMAIIIASPIAGALADRTSRLTIIKVTQTLGLLQSVLLALLAYTGWITIESLVILTLAMGFINGMNQPAHASLVPSIVDKQVLGTAVALGLLWYNVARFVGPLIAGVVLLSGSFAAAFAINALAYAVFLVLLSRLSVTPHGSSPKGRWIDNIREGYAYALRHPGIGPIIVVYSVTAIALRGFIDLLPGFADQIFNRGAEGLAWLTATTGLGAIVGGLWMARRPDAAGLTALTVRCTLVLSAAMLAFTATTNYAAGLLSVFVAGVAMVMITISTQTLMQTAARDDMRGRVLAIYGILFAGLPALNALILGWLSAHYGLRIPLACSAVVCTAFWVWARWRQSIMTRELEIGEINLKPR